MTKSTLLSRAAATAAAGLGACLLAFACPAAAFTSTAGSPGGEDTPLHLSPSSGTTHTSTGGASIVRTIVGLAIVIAVIWGLSWIVRQVKSGRDPQVSSAGLATVAALTLSSGRSLHLVRAGNDYVLLGSAEHGVVPIHRYSEQEAREAGLLDGEPEPQRSRLIPRPRQIAAGSGASGQGAGGRDSGGGGSAGRGSGGQDPMRMPTPSGSIVERLREWTVRR